MGDMVWINLVPRSHSVLHLAVGDLGTRLGLDKIFFPKPLVIEFFS